MSNERTAQRRPLPGSRLSRVTLVVAIVVSLVLVYPYIGLDASESRLGVAGTAHYATLVAHIFTAAVALILGPLQFMARVRARPRVHRTIGRVYLLGGVLPSAVTAVPVALWSGRPVTQAGLTVAAVLWLITGGLAYRAARRRDFTAHREWMLRNYALTFLAVTARVLVPLLLLVRLPFTAESAATLAPTLIPFGQTAGWIINLTVAEAFIRRSRRAAR
ncbi:DUF2306 domain-containing protein [Dactylosporangium sp. NPDC000521]|uniref:DUF2306 domain-containing protein n=1 Tax=Dactylosporangium sp. NPDC000521 TaxID=3363975 RepID=UPI00369A5717